MFSRLDPLFKTTLRQTEATDARLAVRRDEEKEERRNNTQREEDKNETLWEDQTEISVSGLITVLESLVRGPSAAATAVTGVESGKEESGAGQPLPGRAASAASAYQETARRTAGQAAPAAPDNAAAPGIKLTTEETRVINILLDDLRRLQDEGLAVLRIPQGDSFLHSLQAAIRQARP